jgi:hypothetical protein
LAAARFQIFQDAALQHRDPGVVLWRLVFPRGVTRMTKADPGPFNPAESLSDWAERASVTSTDEIALLIGFARSDRSAERCGLGDNPRL